MTVRPLLWPVCLFLFSACERADTVRHYDAPRPAEDAPAVAAKSAPAAGDPHAGMMADFKAPDLTDTAPAGWVREATPPRVENLLRAYHVPVENSSGKALLLAFPPGTGSLETFSDYLTLTVGLTQLSKEEAAKRITTATLGGKSFELITLAGGDAANPRTAMGACLNTPGAVYFTLLSLAGPEQPAVREQFQHWLASFQPGVVSPGATTVSTPTPAAPSVAPSAPSAPAVATGPVPPPSGLKGWKVPEGWAAGPEKSMRAATLLLPGVDDKSFSVIVSVFPGDLGGALPNANRWLKELGLPPVASEAEAVALAKPLGLNGLEGSRYALDGTPRSSRILWVKHQGKSWFFKMIGEAAAVKREEARFEELARSLSF